ncbi:hypothetical protein AX16_007517 [Volvariella volvacea WC 439]|nr:hypothetical protein AX16_007517 [Volvariella volvacea WC 439]
MSVQYERGFFPTYDATFTNAGPFNLYSNEVPRSYNHSSEGSDAGSPGGGYSGGGGPPGLQESGHNIHPEDPISYTTFPTHQPPTTNITEQVAEDTPYIPRAHNQYQQPVSTRLALAPEIRHSPPQSAVSHNPNPFATDEFRIPAHDQGYDTTSGLSVNTYTQHNPSGSANQYSHPTLSQSPFTSPLTIQYRRDQGNRLTPLEQHQHQHDLTARNQFANSNMVSESHMYHIQTQQQQHRVYTSPDRSQTYPPLLPRLSSDYDQSTSSLPATYPPDIYGNPAQASNPAQYHMSSGHAGAPMPALPPTSSVDPPSRFPDAGEYLRGQFNIPPDRPVDLWALPDPQPGERPPHPLPVLIKLAIYGSEKKKLTLKGIYEAIENRFEYYRNDKKEAWKHSIRHNLSLNKVFRRCSRPITEPGKGSYWELDVSNGEGYKRERKRRPKNRSGAGSRRSTRAEEDFDDDEDDDDDLSETASNAGSPGPESTAMAVTPTAGAGVPRTTRRAPAPNFRFAPYDMSNYQNAPLQGPSSGFFNPPPPIIPPSHVSGGSASTSSSSTQTHSPTAMIADPPLQTRPGSGSAYPQRTNPFEHSTIIAANRQALYNQMQSSPSSSQQSNLGSPQGYEYRGANQPHPQHPMPFGNLPSGPFVDQYGQSRPPLGPYSSAHQGPSQGQQQNQGQGQEQSYHGMYDMRYRSESSDGSSTTQYQHERRDTA